MKYIVKLIVVTFFLFLSTNSFAEQKVVVLDMSFLLNSSKAGKEAQEYLKNKFTKNEKNLSNTEKLLKKQEADLLAKKSTLSQEDLKKESDKLRKKVISYQKERRASLDDLAKQRSSARARLVEKVNPILDTYIKENNISIVIDKKHMIGGLNEYDITNIIVERLNKELPSLKLK
jgi:Skp family chaperone for outer membrane proteins|tara:strand:+ start:1772 stop:2296 length:525 start_codon:yes stop_codon:yes gene_type:complete